MRILLGLCVVLLLGGCNRVHSEQPLFFASDAPDAPRLRDGLWVIETDDDCRFNAGKPVNRWPDCADWMLVRNGEILGFDPPGKDEPTGGGEWTTIPYVLAAGAPLVLQLATTEDGKLDHQYFGVKPTAGSAASIAAVVSWPVLCGPPPPKAAKGEKRRFVTLQPLPGLTLTDESCTTDSAEAVRNAAGPSRGWSDDLGKARWVRDAYP